MRQKRFNWRAVTSLYIVLSFLIMTISGLILFIAPPGRIAHWTQLTIVGLTKQQWQAVHTSFTFLFIAAIGIHLYFNWRPLMAYIKTKYRETFRLRRELIAAFFIMLFVFCAILLEITPFKQLMFFGEEMSASWSNPKSEPPQPHAELLTIEQIAKEEGINRDEIIHRLKKGGLNDIDTGKTLLEIADQNHRAPSDLFRLINAGSDGKKTKNQSHISGLGQKTIESVCITLSIPLKDGLAVLAHKGIHASGADRLRDVARDNQLSPMEIFNLLKEAADN